jgi:ABC-type glycerol-3-phosphate transport system substrate-binding protein
MMRLPRLLALSLLAALAFSACGTGSPTFGTNMAASPAVIGGNSSPSPSPNTAPSPTPTPLPSVGVDPAALHGLTIQVWHAFAGPAADLFTNRVAQFNADNQWGIVVTASDYGDYTSLFESMNTALDAGKAPDLVDALPEQTLAWQALGKVVDLQPYLVDPQWGLGKEAIADIPSIFWSQDNVNGKQLGLPAERSARFIFYNQTWAHELGFANPPSTADQFRQQACAANASFLKDADPTNDGYGGWIVDTDWQTTYSWLLAFGGGVADGNTYGLRTDPNLAALQFIKGLFDSHCAWLSTEPTPFDSFARRSALFVSGDLAELPTEMESMKSLKNSDEWTVLPFPGTQESGLVAYGPSYTVLKSTPERQLAAWLFARWLLSPESQAQWVEATGLFPLRNSVMNMIGPYLLASPQWGTAVASLPQAQDVPQMASWRKVRYVLEDGMTVLFQENLPQDKLPALLVEMDAMAQELK